MIILFKHENREGTTRFRVPAREFLEKYESFFSAKDHKTRYFTITTPNCNPVVYGPLAPTLWEELTRWPDRTSEAGDSIRPYCFTILPELPDPENLPTPNGDWLEAVPWEREDILEVALYTNSPPPQENQEPQHGQAATDDVAQCSPKGQRPLLAPSVCEEAYPKPVRNSLKENVESGGWVTNSAPTNPERKQSNKEDHAESSYD